MLNSNNGYQKLKEEEKKEEERQKKEADEQKTMLQFATAYCDLSKLGRR